MATIRRILVAAKLSESAIFALEQAVELAKQAGASIDVLHVWRPRDWLAMPHERAERALEALVTPYWSRGIPIRARMATGDPREVIPRLAREWGSDLIILGRQVATPGSVAEAVMRDAPCPVRTPTPARPPPRSG
jgi:nucleotide-binding universal stress UspA family protein